MTKVKPTTKEQLIYFFSTNVSLGTYDKRFLSNLESSNLIEQRPLTSNQVALLDKIITRYSKQLRKLELDVDELLSLPWTIQPIESLPQFTEAHLNLMDDVLILHSPYKKEFVEEFKQADINGKWDKEERYWSVPSCTHALAIAVRIIEKHYSKVNYCDSIKNFINTAQEYNDIKYWTPTYVYINDMFFVIATNHLLDKAIANIKFDIDLAVLARLVRYGVTIDDSVLMKYSECYSVDEIAFAINHECKLEINNEEIIETLQSIKSDCVVFMEMTGSSQNYFSKLKSMLSDNDIKHLTYSPREPLIESVSSYDFPVLLCSGFWSKAMLVSPSIAKVILVVNSKPINIK